MSRYIWNPISSNLDAQLTPFIEDFKEVTTDQYIPYGQLVITGFRGVKGQWSYYDNKYLICIASDSWVTLLSELAVDEKIKNIIESFKDQYIPYGQLVASSFSGIKGQWSYNDKRHYACIATDTWLITPNEQLVDDKISSILLAFVNQYVPCCLVPNNSAPGLKGQWSFQVGHSSHKGYVKVCIATDTWVRFEVDTLF
jgi:hypothetical protein